MLLCCHDDMCRMAVLGTSCNADFNSSKIIIANDHGKTTDSRSPACLSPPTRQFQTRTQLSPLHQRLRNRNSNIEPLAPGVSSPVSFGLVLGDLAESFCQCRTIGVFLLDELVDEIYSCRDLFFFPVRVSLSIFFPFFWGGGVFFSA